MLPNPADAKPNGFDSLASAFFAYGSVVSCLPRDSIQSRANRGNSPVSQTANPFFIRSTGIGSDAKLKTDPAWRTDIRPLNILRCETRDFQTWETFEIIDRCC